MKQKDTTIEILRIVAIWGVILIHATSTTLAVSGYYLRPVLFTFFLNQLGRFAVPLFFLISGYVLSLRYSESISLPTFYKKRLLKLALPFLIWTFIYYSLVNHAGIKAFFVNLPSLLFYGSGAEHLYFIPAIALLYILFPFISSLLKKFPPTQYPFHYFTFLLLVTSLLFFDYYMDVVFLPTPFRIALLNAPIFVIGMIWAKYRNAILPYVTKKWTTFLLILFFISFLLVELEGHILSIHHDHLAFFMSQWRPSILLYTLCIFSLGIFFIQKLCIKISAFFSSVTFFVFFSHIIFIHLFWKLWGSYLFSKSVGQVVEQLWFDPLVFSFVIVCSYGLAWIVSYIPVAREWLGITS